VRRPFEPQRMCGCPLAPIVGQWTRPRSTATISTSATPSLSSTTPTARQGIAPPLPTAKCEMPAGFQESVSRSEVRSAGRLGMPAGLHASQSVTPCRPRSEGTVRTCGCPLKSEGRGIGTTPSSPLPSPTAAGRGPGVFVVQLQGPEVRRPVQCVVELLRSLLVLHRRQRPAHRHPSTGRGGAASDNARARNGPGKRAGAVPRIRGASPCPLPSTSQRRP